MLLPIKISDAAALTSIAIQSKKYWKYSDKLIESWKKELTISEEIISAMIGCKFVIENQSVGFYFLRPFGENSIELEFLFVLPDFIGKGIGKKLIAHAFETAKQLKTTTMRVLSDPNATAFYASFGFVEIDKKESSIPNRFLPILEKEIR